MTTNIIEEYINLVRKFIVRFYKLTLDKQFEKNMIVPFINKYIMVRYYNETAFPKDKDFVLCISKEMSRLVEGITDSKNSEIVKNIHSLLGYIFYFDDCYDIDDYNEILKIFFEDENIKITLTDELKKEITTLVKEFNNNKKRFSEVIKSNQFLLMEKRLRKGLYKLSLNHNVRISPLYSENAIEKAFNTGTTNEDKLFVTIIMACNQILENTKGLDFSRYYIIDFVPSFFTKEKKIERVFKSINNYLSKKHLILNINYQDYIENKKKVDTLIKSGFSFSVTLDHTFDNNYFNLILFSCVLIYKDDEIYDTIKENEKTISDKLIVL